MKLLQKVAQKSSRFKLAITLTVAIVIALLLTFISVSMYIKSGVASLDLSRPGYEQVRDQIRPSTDNKSFSPNGPVNKAALDEFSKLYQAEIKQLSGGNNFSDKSLSDNQLRLIPQAPEEVPAE